MGDWRDWTEDDTREQVRAPRESDDKYSRGVLGVLTGSATYPGAAVLGVEAAARTGAGMVRYLGDDEAGRLVLQRRPETVTAPGRVQAWLIGSGMDAAHREGRTGVRIGEALAQRVPVVLDAGALDLAGTAAGPTVVTPHAGELVTLLGARGVDTDRAAVTAAPAEWAERSADLLGLPVLLKGHVTHVARPGGGGFRVAGGPAWLATAGSGDVLGGILATLVSARSEDVLEGRSDLAALAAAGAAVHAAAGTLASGGGPLVALDIAESVPPVIARLLGSA